MKAPLRILMLGDGCSFHVERMLVELTKQGQEASLASLEHSELVNYSLTRRGPLPSLHYTLAASQVSEIAREISPHLLYAHYATGYGHLAALANVGIGLPVVLNIWGSDILIVPRKSTLHKAKAVRALRSASFVVSDSAYLLDEAQKIAPFEKSAVIPWGVEQEFLNFYDEGRNRSGPLKVIVPRAHEEVYDNLFILRAMADMVVRKEIELTFPAFGSRVASFRNEAERLTGGKISFYDRLNRHEFMQFYSGFDLFLSNSSSDSSPASMIEAMGLGLTVVARDIPGVREWLCPESGYLFAEGDESQLRAIVQKLRTRGKDDSERRCENRIRVLKEAVFEENIGSQIEIMRKLVAGVAS